MMETKQIISWLLDKAARAQDHSYARMLNMAAKRLKELDATDIIVGSKWIPVTERLPERGQEVIVFSGGVVEGIVFAYHFWNNGFLSWQHITHWMPLPEPPKDVTQNVTQSEPPNEVDR